MELETIILNEVSLRKKYHLYVEPEKKRMKRNLFIKQAQKL